MKMKIRTGKIGDFNPHPVKSKRVARAGMNLAMGYMFLPFVKIKSLSKKRK